MNLFKTKRIKLSDDLETELNLSNISINIAKYIFDDKKGFHHLIIDFNLKNYPETLQSLTVKYINKIDCLNDKNKLFELL